VRLTIDGRTVEAPAGASVLDAALAAGIYVPHLCHHPDLPPEGTCRLCVVEIQGRERPVASCETHAAAGMVVRTQSDEIA
jgi:NADH dehydrogenase/NADH:ubiquinone oxidoreductase subunit G